MNDDDNVFDVELYNGGEYFATAADLYARDGITTQPTSVRDRFANIFPGQAFNAAPPPRESVAEHNLKPIPQQLPQQLPQYHRPAAPAPAPAAPAPAPYRPAAPPAAVPAALYRPAIPIAPAAHVPPPPPQPIYTPPVNTNAARDSQRQDRDRVDRLERLDRERNERERVERDRLLNRTSYVSPYIVQAPIVHHMTNEYNPIVYRRLYDYGVGYIPTYYSYDQRRRAEYLLENLIKKELLAKVTEEELQKVIKTTLANTDTNGKIVETKEKAVRAARAIAKKTSKKPSKKKSKKTSKKKSKKVSKKKSKKTSKKKSKKST